MSHRVEYFLNLSQATLKSRSLDSDYRLRPVSSSDAQGLADLMLDAYKGTIDYHGEDIADALKEVHGYFSGRSGGKDLRDFSGVLLHRGRLVSACLSVKSVQETYPLIAYSMTKASEKKKGLAQYLLIWVLQKLKSAGHESVTAVITEGNTPSERLFIGAGFRATRQ